MFCGKCGKEVRDDDRFCPYCGAVVNQDGAKAEPAPVSDDVLLEGKNSGEEVLNEGKPETTVADAAPVGGSDSPFAEYDNAAAPTPTPAAPKEFCPYCGKEVAQGTVTCPNCKCYIAKNAAPAYPAYPVSGGGNFAQTPATPQKKNIFAVLGMVLSIVGCFFCFIGMAAEVYELILLFSALPEAGLALSIVGMIMSKKRGGAGRGMALAGIIIGAVGFVFAVAGLSIYYLEYFEELYNYY